MEIVDKKPEEGMELNINGEKGKSLFYHPYYQYVQKDVQRISEQYERYKALFEEAKEERLLAIIGALCVEEALDLFLKTWIKDYKMIEEEKEFTKINIAYSLELIPKHILNAVDLIRKIRNEFVHNLIIDKFDLLDKQKYIQKLLAQFNEFFPDNKKSDHKTKDVYISVVETVLFSLGIYASHLKIANEFVYSEEFMNELNKRFKK